MDRWTQAMVESLLNMKRAGNTNFDWCWDVARTELAPTLRAPAGTGRRQLALIPEEEGDEAIPYFEFFREACRREWYGEVDVDFTSLAEFAEGVDEGAAVHPIAGHGRGRAMVLLA